jgi:hypothetical protein
VCKEQQNSIACVLTAVYWYTAVLVYWYTGTLVYSYAYYNVTLPLGAFFQTGLLFGRTHEDFSVRIKTIILYEVRCQVALLIIVNQSDSVFLQ